MSTPENVDLTNSIVAELGRLFLLVEALQASHLSLQAQVDTLKERVATLEKEPASTVSETAHADS